MEDLARALRSARFDRLASGAALIESIAAGTALAEAGKRLRMAARSADLIGCVVALCDVAEAMDKRARRGHRAA